MTDRVVKLTGMVPDHLKVRQTKLVIESLEVPTDIGFHDFEVGSPQRLHVSVELWLDDNAPPPDDNPDMAWNYDFLRDEVIRLATERRYNLQETLVHAIFQRIAACRGVEAIRVRSVKPDVYPDVSAVGVEIASFKGITP
ncbi:dihydroneopterin aldolase [Sphingomonas jaspsi]|uniref:dihydroneopterin aldolase n=1 Tax=Sphingomonas jaspsi TaxID=392409 RepID=UPI0004B7DDFB|nr:dihydroneopterin aldolase [Sphingomonas jaspsi]